MTDLQTQISPGCVQELLDSAPNARRKGQAQYFTPLAEGARALAHLLPSYRPILTDLNCGGGHLFHLGANATTHTLLGVDIDACAGRRLGEVRVDSRRVTKTQRLTADLTRLYPVLRAVDFRADCFVLNPPWDLHWYREPLAGLAQSPVPAVREAFAAQDGRVPRECLDSSVATLLIALDRCSAFGEGFLITNAATAERLILGNAERGTQNSEQPPHSALLRHLWAVVPLPEMFPVPAVALFFALGHTAGPVAVAPRRHHRRGAELMLYLPASATSDTLGCWEAAAEGWHRLKSGAPPPFNLFLKPGGTIGTALSLYDQKTRQVDKQAAADLHALNGQHPMQLVLQRAARENLLSYVDGNAERGTRNAEQIPRWSVDPKLAAAVHSAVREYHSARAPLYPLPDNQRLGYLDEEDQITCRVDLPGDFRAGQSYPISSETVPVTRTGERMNLTGGMDMMAYTGHEIVYQIHGERGERAFRVDAARWDSEDALPALDFEALVRHFIIPEVPDVAACFPQQYQTHLHQLQQLEALTQEALTQ